MKQGRMFMFLIWTFLVVLLLTFSDLYPMEGAQVKVVVVDSKGNTLKEDEAAVLPKHHSILISAKTIGLWLSHPENKLELNPSLETPKDMYIIGITDNFDLLLKINDVNFWQNKHSSSTQKIPKNIRIEGDLSNQRELLLKNLHDIVVEKIEVNEDIKRIVDRYIFFADAEMKEGDYQAAEEDLRKITDLLPSYYEAWVRLSKIFAKKNDMENANECILLALKANPFQKDLYITYGINKLASLNYQAAFRALNKAYFLYPSDPKVLYHYGIIASVTGDVNLAKELKKRLERLDRPLATNLQRFIQ